MRQVNIILTISFIPYPRGNIRPRQIVMIRMRNIETRRQFYFLQCAGVPAGSAVTRPTWLLPRPLPGAGILTSSKDEEELGWTFISSRHKTLRKMGLFSHKSVLLLSFQGIVEYCSGCQVDSSFIC